MGSLICQGKGEVLGSNLQPKHATAYCNQTAVSVLLHDECTNSNGHINKTLSFALLIKDEKCCIEMRFESPKLVKMQFHLGLRPGTPREAYSASSAP